MKTFFPFGTITYNIYTIMMKKNIRVADKKVIYIRVAIDKFSLL